jgi:hypothetical protein
MAKTCLKVLKINCIRLRKSLSLEALACLEVCPLGHDGLVLLSVVTQTLLCNFLCACSPFLLFGDADDGYQWELQVSQNWIRTGAHRRRRVAEGGFHLYGEVNALDRQVKCFYRYVLSFEPPSASHPCNL